MIIISQNAENVNQFTKNLMKRGDSMALAENIKRLREMHGLTQEELASYAKVTREAVYKYEVGKMIPNVETAVDIAEKLGVTCEELVRGSQTKSES